MSSDYSVPIEGHVESTVYVRDGEEYISLQGKEFKVFDYRPGSSSTPIKVVKRGQKYSTLNQVPVEGSYVGNDIMDRISHEVSAFYTQLKDIIWNAPGLDISKVQALSDRVINALHDCGAAIDQEQSKTREVMLDHETMKYDLTKATQELKASNEQLYRIEKRSNTHAKAVKHLMLSSSAKTPLLHQLCSENGVSITNIIREYQLDVHQRTKLAIFDEIEFYKVDAVSPIYAAAIAGNVSAMQELYDLDSLVFDGLSGEEKHMVVGAAAYGSLECFELAKNWMKPDAALPTLENLCKDSSVIPLMAARGGNMKVLSSLIPDPSTFSVPNFFTDSYWREFFTNAFIGGALDWLATLGHANLLLTDDLFVMTLSKINRRLIRLDSLKWMISVNCSPEKILEAEIVDTVGSTTFQNSMAKCGRIDILDWLSSIPGFSLTARDGKGSTLMHEACYTNAVNALEWAFHHPTCTQDDFHIIDTSGHHMVHTAAENGSLDCLKWICNNIHKFQHVRGSSQLLSILGRNSLTVLHGAALSCDLDTLQWFQSHHMGDYSKVPRDKKGRMPIHYAAKELRALKWMAEVANCDLSTTDADGAHVIHYAIYFNNIASVDFILSKIGPACLLASTVKAGRSAVHFISSEEMGEFLCKHGVNLSKKSYDGVSLFTLKPQLQTWLASKGVKK